MSNSTYAIVASLLGILIGGHSMAQGPQPSIDLGTGDRVAKINLERLLMDDPRGIREPLFQLRLENFLATAKRSDFFTDANASGACDSPVREGFRCLELNNAQAGYIVTPVTNAECRYPYFHPMNHKTRPLYVYFDFRNYQFWIRVPDPERIYGPFYRDPVEKLKNAVIPYKERRSFAGLDLKFLSRRWEFPDEKAAMANRKSSDYDFAGGRISEREKEAGRLNSAFFRFRLTNNGKDYLFILYRNGRPDVTYLSMFRKERTWRLPWGRDTDAADFYDGQHLSWEALPPGSAFEFETKAGCFRPMLCGIRLYINEERGFRDPVAVDVRYPNQAKREFSRKNRPPPR